MTVREALTHPWLTIRVQLALGAIFIAAAIPKIIDPPSFAHMIYNYRLLPSGLVNISSIIMPWVEIVAGLLLVLGIWKRAAAGLVAAMLVAFIIAISINLIRGHAIDCGCFNVSQANYTYEQRINVMKLDILRDLGMLLMCAQLFWSWRLR